MVSLSNEGKVKIILPMKGWQKNRGIGRKQGIQGFGLLKK